MDKQNVLKNEIIFNIKFLTLIFVFILLCSYVEPIFFYIWLALDCTIIILLFIDVIGLLIVIS